MSCALVCNTNTLENTDYGIPITVQKSTDYRTTTGTNHRLIPAQPQDFDCAVPSKVPTRIEQPSDDNKLLDARYETTYSSNYYFKQAENDPNEFKPRPWYSKGVDYSRTVQEKMWQSSAPPFKPFLSEMKESYPRLFIPFIRREVYPPEPYELCEVRALGRDEQPPLRPEGSGYMKFLDPYLTTTRADYIPYSQEKQDGIGRKDITTFYDATGVPRGGKGYGPRNGPTVAPLIIKRQPLYPDRITPNRAKLLPNFGMKSEYQDLYVKQTFSAMHPYLHENGVIFEEPLAGASAWQNLVPPGMYCSEQCHVGSGWPVTAVVDPGQVRSDIVHQLPPDC